MGSKKSSKGQPLIVHTDECDLLRQWLEDPPLDGAPLDGRGYIPHEPIPPDEILDDRGPTGHAELDALAQAYQKGRALARTPVELCYYGSRLERHVFLTDDAQILARVSDVWRKQCEPIGHEIKFLIQVVAQFPREPRRVNRLVSVGTLFAPDSLPEGFAEVETKQDDTTLLVFRCADAPEIADERVEEVRAQARGWLLAYTFHQAVGLRVVRETVRPVRRRFFDWEIGPEYTIIQPIPATRMCRTADSVQQNERAARALHGMNMALCAPTDEEVLFALWRTAEDLWVQGERTPSILDGLSSSSKRQIKRLLCQLLGDDKGIVAYEHLCRLKDKGRNEILAEGIADVLPQLGYAQILDAIKRISGTRGRMAHSLHGGKDLMFGISALFSAVGCLVENECGLRKDQTDA